MMLLLGLLLALNVGLCAMLLPERALRTVFGVLAALILAHMVWNHLQNPGHELASLLAFGIALAGVLPGASGVVLSLPLAVLLPLSLNATGGVSLAVHSHWHTVGAVILGFGLGAALRQAWFVVHEESPRWGRPALLTALLAGPATFLALTTPTAGSRAWNILLPMASMDGLEARMVILEEGGASSWPWLEPLQFGLILALGIMGFSALLYAAVRQDSLRHRLVMSFFALAVMVAFGLATIASPGALVPLESVDPEMVMKALLPSFVPNSALSYLSPERDVWRVSPAALSLWFGLAAWLASAALLTTRAWGEKERLRRESTLVAPLVLLAGALCWAEAWSEQGMGVASQQGAQGLVFALAAWVLAATLIRGSVRLYLWLATAAVSAAWLVAFVAERVVA